MDEDWRNSGDDPSKSAGETLERLTEAQREQIKLGAAYLNGIASSLIIVGGLAIPTSILLNIAGKTVIALMIGIFCFVASPALHQLAKRSLKGLDR